MKNCILLLAGILLSVLPAPAQKKIFDDIAKGDISAVEHYIKKGGDLNVMIKKTATQESTGQKTDYELTLLEWAALKGQEEIVTLLLANKDRIIDPKTMISKALAFCISSGKLSIVKRLYEAGGDINYKCISCHHQAPIQTAIFYKYTDIFNYLYNQGADLSVRNDRGQTLLHISAFVGDKGISELLLGRGFDVNARDSMDDTPLMFAAESGDSSIFFMLLRHSGDLRAKDKDKDDLLFFAALGGTTGIMEYLLGTREFSVNTLDINHNTPLLFAFSEGQSAAAQWLLDHGSDPDVLNNDNETPLYWAIVNKDEAMARKLAGLEQVSLVRLDYVKYAKDAKCSKEFVAWLTEKVKLAKAGEKKQLEEKKGK
jgi:ankyrin repeat protein